MIMAMPTTPLGFSGTGKSPSKPVLLLGPSGIGKTRAALEFGLVDGDVITYKKMGRELFTPGWFLNDSSRTHMLARRLLLAHLAAAGPSIVLWHLICPNHVPALRSVADVMLLVPGVPYWKAMLKERDSAFPHHRHPRLSDFAWDAARLAALVSARSAESCPIINIDSSFTVSNFCGTLTKGSPDAQF